MLPGYAFIKTHKVGGTTITGMLERTLRETQNATPCDNYTKETRRVVHPPPPGCSACLTHASYRLISNALHFPKSDASQAAVRKVCPFWVPGRRIHTMIMLREPVDRAYARYHFERSDGWCRRKAAALGMRGCASDHYAFFDWALVPQDQLKALSLHRSVQRMMLSETVAILGGKGSVADALRVLARIEVVGLTHRFNDTLRVLSTSWGLPLPVLEKHLTHANAGTPRPPLNASFLRAMRRQSHWLQQEWVLYDYAERRLTQNLKHLEAP